MGWIITTLHPSKMNLGFWIWWTHGGTIASSFWEQLWENMVMLLKKFRNACKPHKSWNIIHIGNNIKELGLGGQYNTSMISTWHGIDFIYRWMFLKIDRAKQYLYFTAQSIYEWILIGIFLIEINFEIEKLNKVQTNLFPYFIWSFLFEFLKKWITSKSTQ